ncbi:MAG: hypothetical protein JKY93_13100, partial [Gammaproteobacteria bacterium]|nr:hypothetical protein [Gammaproteobacteria bacterium]
MNVAAQQTAQVTREAKADNCEIILPIDVVTAREFKEFAELLKSGFQRVKVDGEFYE